MPPKKKKKQQEEDPSTEKLVKIYRKKCEANQVVPYKRFRQKIDEKLEENEHLTSFIGLDYLGPMGITSMCEAMSELEYKHLKELKLYKCGIGDEGCKAIADYMTRGKNVKILVLPDNDITAVGCDYLANVLAGSFKLPLIKLKLDLNDIGTQGLKNLVTTLASNGILERLSLKYCSLEPDSAKYLQQILGYVDTKLWSLKLKGNYLRNEGVYQLFRALEANKILNKLDISNNQFGESDEIPVIQKICEVITINTTCYYYDFTENGIYDKGGQELLECVKLYKHIWRMFLPYLMSKEVQNEFKKVLKKRKKPKKKKKKKKGGKKKKKK